jgi:hypothetical protein
MAEKGISIYAWRGQTEEDFWWCIDQCLKGIPLHEFKKIMYSFCFIKCVNFGIILRHVIFSPIFYFMVRRRYVAT